MCSGVNVLSKPLTEVHAISEGKFTGFQAEFNRSIQVEFTDDWISDVRPLFTTTIRKTKEPALRPVTDNDMGRMITRRKRNAGLPSRLSHSLTRFESRQSQTYLARASRSKTSSTWPATPPPAPPDSMTAANEG